MNEDLKIIKKKYGEKMAQLCRELFSSLLEKEGLLPTLLLNKFPPSRTLYYDIIKYHYEENFKNYIYGFVDVEQKEIDTHKTLIELFNKAGYDFYECKTEEDIQKYRKYYAEGEELCTFRGKRLDRCHVFWAVKKNVDEIKRKNFKNPTRQDLYGTSVISIQFTRGNVNTLSIKNRYNHHVNNPDATFSNNLENIMPGLTAAFEREYGFNINQTDHQGFELPNYVMGNNRKFYRYNYEYNNIYYCENNVIVANGEVIELDKSRFLLIDYFIIDLKDKKIAIIDPDLYDSFPDIFNKVDRIYLENEAETGNKTIKVYSDGKEIIKIKIDRYGKIIKLEDHNTTIIKDNFLRFNKTITELELSELQETGNYFLPRISNLKELKLPKLEIAGKKFLPALMSIDKLEFPNLKRIDADFLGNCDAIEKLSLPNLEEVGNYFMANTSEIKEISLPKLKKTGIHFLSGIYEIEELNFPNLEEAGHFFMLNCETIKTIKLPKLKNAGAMFLASLEEIKEINFPKLEKAGDKFMEYCTNIEKINLPELKITGDSFLSSYNNSEENRRIK